MTVLRAANWEARVRVHEHSTQTKEQESGADFGVIIEIDDRQGRRVQKALLVQAKMVRGASLTPSLGSDLRREVAAMLSHTDHSYVLGYAAHGLVAYAARGYEDVRIRHASAISFGRLVRESAHCDRGDEREELVEYARERDHLLVEIQERRRSRP